MARDEPLEEAFARRDAAAYDAVYRQFGGRMYATALRVLQRREPAHECVHDVLLRLWQRGNAYAPARGNLEAFLVACVRNEALARVRNEARRARIIEATQRPSEASFDPDPVERDRIARAVGALTPGQNETIRLAYYRGMTLAEIARELNEPIGTVKSRLAAALRALRRTLVDEEHDV